MTNVMLLSMNQVELIERVKIDNYNKLANERPDDDALKVAGRGQFAINLSIIHFS